MDEPINGTLVGSDPAEEQRVAAAADYATGRLLAAITDGNTAYAGAVLAGALSALVRFTFDRCWPSERIKIASALIRMWTPGIRSAAADMPGVMLGPKP